MVPGNHCPYFAYLYRLVDAMIANVGGFNEYVAGNLPYQQRTGRIARKDFNRIVPRLRIELNDRETSLKALEDSLCGCSVPPLGTMTIRQYCKYFRIAHEVYSAYYRKRGVRDCIYEDLQDVPEELRDVVYYNQVKFLDVENCTTLTARRISCGLQRIIMVNWVFHV